MRKGCILAGLLLLIQTAPGWGQTFLHDSYEVAVNAPLDTWQPDNRCWFRADYLLWQLPAAPLPSLVTTGGANLGALGFSDTRVLYGGSQSYGLVSGVRADTGLWFTCNNTFGIEGSYFQTAGLNRSYGTSSAGSILSLPFLGGTIVPIANPATPQYGSVQYRNDIGFLGGDLDLLFLLMRHDLCECNFLIGYQSVYLRENLNGNYSTAIPATITTNTYYDSFGTQNVFYGANFGLRGILRWGNLSLNATAKLGVGSMLQIVNINGQTTSVVNGVATVTPVGVYAQSSNSGHFNTNAFCIIPHGELRLGWAITSHLTLSIGYDFLTVSNVVRPGNQLNQNVGAVYNTANFNTSWFNVMGYNLGLEIRF